MPISANRLDAQALSVEFVDASIRVILDDGREISAPLAWFPRFARRLGRATDELAVSRSPRGHPLAGPR
jgi:hypothetical protein